MVDKRKIKFEEFVKEVYLQNNIETLDFKEKQPTITMVRNIIKVYEDLLVLYLISGYKVRTRLGVFNICLSKSPLTKNKNTYYPRLSFSNTIKNLLKPYYADMVEILESGYDISLPEETFNKINFKLKHPRRDLE